MQRLTTAVSVALLASASLFAAVGQPANAQNTLVVAGVTTAQGLDGDITQPGTIETAVNVYEALVAYGVRKDANGNLIADPTSIQPHLAESWETSADGKTVTFTLRRDAKSVAGNTISPEDIIFGFEKSKSQKRFGNFMIRISQTENIEAVGDNKVRFTLSKANRLLIPILYTYAPQIIDSKTAREHATSEDPFATKWLARNTAGYGAYHVANVRPGEGMTWEFNKNYFGEEPFYTRVVYREVPTPSTRAALIKSGSVQWAEDMPIDQITDLQKDPNVKVVRVDGTGSAYAAMNPNYPPFDDPRVRRAIVLATDYNGIAEAVFRGTGTKVQSILSPAFEGFAPSYNDATDLDRARALLAEAGHGDGLDILLEYSNRYWWEEGFAIQLKNSLAQVGIDLSIKRIPAAELVNRRVKGKTSLPFFTTSINSFVLDPAYKLLAVAHSEGVANWNAYNNPRMDEIVDAMLVESDPARFRTLTAEAQKVFADDAMYVDSFFPGNYAVMAPCITGWVWQPHERNVFRTLRCE